MSDFQHYPSPEQHRHSQQMWVQGRMADATSETARNVGRLLEQAQEQESREMQMLRWAKVSGVAAIVAALLALVAIVVTIGVA